jgi:hypothetical protein
LIKRSSLGHSPVEQDGLVIDISKADSTDVPKDGILVVTGKLQPTEGQPLVDLA